MLSEELALRELQSEFGVPISRQVALTGPTGKDQGFDGVFSRGPETFIVEVKTLRNTLEWDRRVRELRWSLRELQMRLPSHLKSIVLLALVADAPDDRIAAIKAKVEQTIAELEGKFAFRVYSLAELKKKYGLLEDE